jgi:hypothetical protein
MKYNCLKQYITLVILFLLISDLPVYSQPVVDTIINGVSYYKKRQYTLSRTSVPPVIDGKLEDRCWTEKMGKHFTHYSPQKGEGITTDKF